MIIKLINHISCLKIFFSGTSGEYKSRKTRYTFHMCTKHAQGPMASYLSGWHAAFGKVALRFARMAEHSANELVRCECYSAGTPLLAKLHCVLHAWLSILQTSWYVVNGVSRTNV